VLAGLLGLEVGDGGAVLDPAIVVTTARGTVVVPIRDSS